MNANLSTPAPRTLDVAVAVLRAPAELLAGDERIALTRYLVPLLTIVVGAGGLFGLVIGTYCGGLQLLFAAIKLPVVLLLPLLICLPAVGALYRNSAVELGHPRLVLAALVGVARASLLAAALGPALWLFYSVDIDYHLAVLMLVGTLGVAGMVGLLTMSRLLPSDASTPWFAHVVAIGLVGTVLAQGGWLLRPFLVRPHSEVTFLRAIEDDVFSSVGGSWRSSTRAAHVAPPRTRHDSHRGVRR